MVSVLVNAVEGGEDVLKHRSVNTHLEEETGKKNVNGLTRDTCLITAHVLSFNYREIHSPRSFPTFVVC